MSDLYIARQPIYDRQLTVYGYELLYRAGATNSANVVDGDVATSQVLVNALMEIGLSELVGRSLAFINLTERYIVEGLPEVMAQAGVVLEILEDVLPGSYLLDALASLKAKGYTIALDDFVYHDDKRPLLVLADLVKIDLSLNSSEGLEAEVERIKPFNTKLLAPASHPLYRRHQRKPHLAHATRSPHEVQRNAGNADPDSVSLHPGYCAITRTAATAAG